MQLLQEKITETFNEKYLVESFNLNNKIILELGCGNASMTKKIAQNGFDRKIIAYEIDEIQHKKNAHENINNIDFILGKAQEIKLEDESVDMIFLFKSFHHIPKNDMYKSLIEMKRVLKKNGLIYISEPLFQGEQNHLVSLFHDEEQVRIDAFDTIQRFVENQQMKLFKEIFFQTEVFYKDFKDFETKQMNLSYNENRISKELYNKVKEAYFQYANSDESAKFLKPFRVDILQK